MTEPVRSVSLLGALAIGIGGMVGGGIFAVLGEAVSLAHGATAVAFLVAGAVALLTSYAYAKLSVTFQSQGGTVVFIDKAFRHNILSSSMNFMLWLSYLVTISLYAVAFSSYAQTFFPNEHSNLLNHFFITLAILLPTLINWISAAFVSRSETFIVLIKVFLLVVIIVTGASFVDPKALDPHQWKAPFSIFVAGMIIFVAYEGFELIANSAEEIKDPERNLPRAFYGSILFVILLYVLIAIITVGAVPEAQLMQAKDYALALAAKPAMGQLGFTLVAVAALLATFSAINATIYGNARLGYIIAKEGNLPKFLEKEKRNQPFMATVATSVLSLLLANSISLNEIAIIGSASFLLVFLMVNLSALKLYDQIQGNRWIFFIAGMSSLAALITLLIHTYETQKVAVLIFFAFVLLSVSFEVLYGRWVRGHFFYRSYPL
ncbi:APC family permease [Hydrogenovibrio marinus]|uniref:Amino acid transporter n=1 Tax=Hydrogenovibrio marinus TaxID=28885 RepID=A0A066ZQH4_HYDMR|nr:APC family permease [Hydrogenovibrio marinus]KDN96063.1 amino acid transporter [Hydrogenovibrio marinus]BBN58440.1 amino acid transporter [Hydrogenovibrio marinus]